MRPVSVVVATYRRPELLPRLFAALAAQDVPLELVVVDDASGDGTAAVLQGLASAAPFPVEVLTRKANGGPAAARETGWRVASHELIAFTDDDCVPRPGWLAELSAHEGVVVGRTVAAPDQEGQRGVFSRTVETTGSNHAQTCNVLYPRALLVELGGFDVALRTGEDTDLALRARARGATVTFAPKAVVEHDIRPSSLAAAVREAWSWSDLPGVVARHPAAAQGLLYKRIWWKPSHPLALLAVTGLAVRRPVSLLLVVPWARYRLAEHISVSPRRRAVSLPGQLAVDLVEVAAMARGSVKHKRVLL